jgi:hypothetical protein
MRMILPLRLTVTVPVGMTSGVAIRQRSPGRRPRSVL